MRYSSNLALALALSSVVSAHEIFTVKSGRFLESEFADSFHPESLAEVQFKCQFLFNFDIYDLQPLSLR
jgi:hypothetical protein